MQKLANFIGGRFVEPTTRNYIESFNPGTGKIIHLVPDSGSDDVEEAVDHAWTAFHDWSQTSLSTRAKLMHQLASLIERDMLLLAEAESQDQGKTVKQALEIEIPRCAANLRYFANLASNFYETGTTMHGIADSITVHEPMGVVGIISPWNLPLYLLTWKLAPAIAMGNCVVAKPSELTSLTAFMLAALIKEAGFPNGVINIVFGLGPKVGEALVTHPTVRAISFTGGTATGRKIAALAAPSGKKISLELGGKNAAIVFSDCDLEKAIMTCVRSGFSNQGEICLCTSRIYVQRPIFDEFLSQYTEKVTQLKVGDPRDPKSDLGALISKEHLEKVCSYIEMARREGVKILCEGSVLAKEELGGGFFVSPVVLTDVQETSALMCEEIFGPVVCISCFDTEEEVVTRTNNVEYGLAASIFTNDGQKSRRVAKKIKAGVVWVNCWMVRDLATPFGGVKASGYGREGGKYSLEFFSDIKTITSAI